MNTRPKIIFSFTTTVFVISGIIFFWIVSSGNEQTCIVTDCQVIDSSCNDGEKAFKCIAPKLYYICDNTSEEWSVNYDLHTQESSQNYCDNNPKGKEFTKNQEFILYLILFISITTVDIILILITYHCIKILSNRDTGLIFNP